MNVSLMLLILVAYIQDWGLLYTLRNQCLDQLRHLVFPGFCSDFCWYYYPLPTGNVSGIKGQCLGLISSVYISVQKQTPIRTTMVVSKY